jgi:hypothetical protein
MPPSHRVRVASWVRCAQLARQVVLDDQGLQAFLTLVVAAGTAETGDWPSLAAEATARIPAGRQLLAAPGGATGRPSTKGDRAFIFLTMERLRCKRKIRQLPDRHPTIEKPENQLEQGSKRRWIWWGGRSGGLLVALRDGPPRFRQLGGSLIPRYTLVLCSVSSWVTPKDVVPFSLSGSGGDASFATSTPAL